MNKRQYYQLTNFQKRIFQNTFYLLCLIFSFFMGNFIALISIDANQCDHHVCAEKLKQTSIEDTNQWTDQWFKERSKGFEKVVFLFILITSAPGNLDQRNAIRQTWLKNENSDTMHYFSISLKNLPKNVNESIHAEQKIHGDLILLKHVHDSYQTLAQKVLSSLIYVHQNVKFRFLLKCDDDSFVNLQQLHLHLKNAPFKQRLYWGFFDGRATPKQRGQWKENDWLLCDHYLPYALGGGYIISDDLVTFIAQNARYLKLYNSEDVSMGAWLAPLDLHRVHDPLFDTEYRSRGCNNNYLVSHKQSVSLMNEKYNTLLNTGHLCKKEFKDRKSYIYNWKVPPSQCCIRNDSSIP